MYWTTAFGAQSFCVRNLQLTYWWCFGCDSLLLSCCFQSSLCFLKVWLQWVLVWVSDFFILSGACWASWMFMSFTRCRTFTDIISSDVLSVLFSLFRLRCLQGVYWYAWGGPTATLASVHLYSAFIYSSCSSGLIISFALPSISDSVLCWNLLWIPLVSFSFQLWCFSAPDFFCLFLLRFSVFLDMVFSFIFWLSPHILLVLWASLRHLF